MSKNNFRPEYQAKLPKTDHDLSHKVVFSSSVGHLLPVFHHIVNPGENLKVDIDLFTRTQPLVTAAMVDVEEKVDFFFIPFPYIFTAFEPRLYGTTDYLSSNFQIDGRDDQLGFPLLVSWFPTGGTDDAKDYGEYWRTHLSSNPDLAKVNGSLSYCRLATHLHYNPLMAFNGTTYSSGGQNKRCSNNVMPSVFPYALYCYHAIYYNFFSNQDFEKRQVQFYNADKYVFSTQSVSSMFHQFFNLHYVSYGPDYFQDSFISPLLSSKNLTTNLLSNSALQNSLRLYLGDSPSVYPADSSATSTANDSEFVQVSAGDNGSFALATNQLRANFALEKYLRVLGRADKTYDAQVLAHFGFKVPTDYKHQVQHIGHFAQEIHIGEVVSTAQTYTDSNTGASLGEIVGKGYGKGVRENMVDFTAPCHGIIMAVYHARPKLIYNNFGFDRINWFTGVTSLYNPEYDALGAQPIFNTELLPPSNNWVGNPTIIRWTDRYHEFKHKFNWATLAFSEDVKTTAYYRKFNQWSSWINGSVPLRWDANQGEDPDLYIQSNLVFPDDLDNLFTVGFVKTYNPAYIDSPWLIFQGDPFMHELKFNMTLWSSMSKTGEPKMDM